MASCLSRVSQTWPFVPGCRVNQLSVPGILDLTSSTNVRGDHCPFRDSWSWPQALSCRVDLSDPIILDLASSTWLPGQSPIFPRCPSLGLGPGLPAQPTFCPRLALWNWAAVLTSSLSRASHIWHQVMSIQVNQLPGTLNLP